MISSNNASITNNTSSIGTNTVNISSIQDTNTAQDNLITTNTENITTNASSINNLNTIIRQDGNAVHIGQNSVVFEDSGSYDAMYSSNDQLNIGRVGHNTQVVGTLSVPNPTLSDHATNKRYVDAGLAQVLAAAVLPQAMHGESNVSIAMGQHNNERAVALGLSHHDNENNVIYRFIGSRSNNSSSSAVSIGWGF